METEKYERLKELLLQNKNWPLLYMFKFIVPNSDDRVKHVSDILEQYGELSFKHTKNLKHVSITCKAWMPEVDKIIDITREISAIEGVISL